MRTLIRKPVSTANRDFWTSPLDQLVNSFFNDSVERNEHPNFFKPQMDVAEKKDAYEIQMNLPGIAKEEVTITVKNGSLTISGEKKSTFTEESEVMHFSEIHFGKFSRSIQLPENIDADSIEGTMKDGVLSIHIPKVEKEDTKVISLK
jgi:HSP20 family protein